LKGEGERLGQTLGGEGGKKLNLSGKLSRNKKKDKTAALWVPFPMRKKNALEKSQKGKNKGKVYALLYRKMGRGSHPGTAFGKRVRGQYFCKEGKFGRK